MQMIHKVKILKKPLKLFLFLTNQLHVDQVKKHLIFKQKQVK